jgi:hypothetical protein
MLPVCTSRHPEVTSRISGSSWVESSSFENSWPLRTTALIFRVLEIFSRGSAAKRCRLKSLERGQTCLDKKIEFAMKCVATLRIRAVRSGKNRHTRSLHLAHDLKVLRKDLLPSLRVQVVQFVIVLVASPQSVKNVESRRLCNTVMCEETIELLGVFLVKGVEESLVEIGSELGLIGRTFSAGHPGVQLELLAAAIQSGRRGEGKGDETYHVGHGTFALSVSGGQVLDARRASGDQLQRSVPGARIVSTADGSAVRHRTASRRILAGSGDEVTILKGA